MENKASTVKGRSVPQLRFPRYQDVWFEKRLSDLLTFKNGLNASKEDYGSGYKFINVLDIINNDFIDHDKIIGSVNVSEVEFQKNIVEYGDILFQRSSETREEVGQANVYLDKEVPATFGGFVIRGKKKTDYDPIFLNFLLKTATARKEITSKSGGSTRYNVGQDTLCSVLIKTTVIEEQTKIAKFLTAVDKRIKLLQEKKAALELYKKGVMQKVFNQELRFKDGNGNNYPDWEEKKLGEVLSIGSGRDYKHLKSGNIPVYGTGGLMLFVNDFLYDGESVCIGRKGTIDKPIFLKEKFWTVDTLFYTHSFKKVMPYFIYLIFQQIHWYNFNEASGVPSLSKSTLEKIKIEIPSLPEQQKIANFLLAIDRSINQVDKQVGSMQEWKKGLLQKMFV
ncbi:MAG: restriction endonuclease subunit S [Bacteroidales bacterium]|nr:restriction endonuclease subunit S [Bacteroidales bacterium]